MPIQVERRPTEPLEPIDPRSATAKQQAQQQQQIAHREALRIALGSILTPKRPQSSASPNPSSRSTSGTASPAYPFAHGLSASGTHTPVGTPGGHSGYHPLQAHGPNSSEGVHLHLHSYYGHGHGHGPYHGTHGHQPSRLGPSRSNSSTSPSPTSSAHASSHPSPHPVAVTAPPAGTPALPAIELLPPAVIVTTAEDMGSTKDATKPIRPSILPLHPSANGSGHDGMGHATDPMTGDHVPASGSGASTPRSKFLQTLQSKSAWDALIHGSFT